MLKLRVSGAGQDKPVLVLLHGWGMGAAVWSRLTPLLSDRYQLMELDLPGYGDNVDVAADSLVDVAQQVSAVVPAGATWLGWSLGGMVALQAASDPTIKMSRLILVASSPRFVRDDDWPHAMAAEQLSLFADGLLADVDTTLKRFVALQFYGQDDAREISRSLQKSVIGQPVNKDALSLGLEMLASEDLRQIYAGLKTPIQHVYGAMDKLVPVKVSEDLSALNPAVEQVVFKGVGHAPFVSHPKMFVERLGL